MPAIHEARCFTSHVPEESKVACWLYHMQEWNRRESKGNNMWQAYFKMLKVVMEAHIHRSRGCNV